ncbi:hypothetical protein JQN58_04945 [Aneurinibacillus sp. BA2021]|nr:hypothetical protein [Aneurinibacillus sp. BA2021]
MARIKLIDKDTDLSSIGSPFPWDTVVEEQPYDVYQIDGYVHSIGGGWGENCYWACPRGETPTHENLIQFAGHSVNWGIQLEQHNRIKCKWDEAEALESMRAVITRNGEKFYSVPGRTFDYCYTAAMQIIYRAQEHVIPFHFRDFEKDLIGRKIYYDRVPAIIKSYIKGQGCVMIEPEEGYTFPRPIYLDRGEEHEDSTSVKADMFADGYIWWFRN